MVAKLRGGVRGSPRWRDSVPWPRCGGKSPVLAAFQNLDMGLASAFPEAPEAGCGSLRESGREPRKGAKDRLQRGGPLLLFQDEVCSGIRED